MSHWKTAKCKLNCSLAVLRRALINIIPKWEKYIKTSESANLEIINTYTRETEKGYSLVIPQGGETGISYGDVGFKKNAKGEWEIRHDVVPYEIGNNFSGRLEQEVGAMKVRAAIQLQGFTMRQEENKGGEKIIRFIRPANQAHQI